MGLNQFAIGTTLMGKVIDTNPDQARFNIICRSGDTFEVSIGQETRFDLLQNLDGINRDRYPTPPDFKDTSPDKIKKYLQHGELVVLQGVYQENSETRQFNARTVTLLQSDDGNFLFEETHWWLTQIARLSDSWLGYLFPNKQSYAVEDFKLYQTNLNIIGLPEDDNVQECATLSRLIYGLSSTFLLTGCLSYLSAAHAAVKYLRETFRSLSSDGQHCFWASGKRKTKYSYQLYITSLNSDDQGTIPLYEQIYALAGLSQYYRITLDWEVLKDIRRTVRAFNKFFLDPNSVYGKNAYGDYFSHLDYATMNWNSDALGHNQARKNWNSIGDHIPAYLVNVILALEPLPIAHSSEEIREFLSICKKILRTTSTIIVDKFPDSDTSIPFVNERFFRNWEPDRNWRWQQDRAVVGHNLKIAWNLTRVANYYYSEAEKLRFNEEQQVQEGKELADKLMYLAERLGTSIAKVGVDLFRGGIFDLMERTPKNGMPVEFPWMNTKDFWQQEQAILAYLILYGCSHQDQYQRKEYLQLARETEAFWNLFFLDQDNKGIFFRVTDGGVSVIQGIYGQKGSHSISAYHAFELNYLAHIYTNIYVNKQPFCLYFRPNENCRQRSLNVLPDFLKPHSVEVTRVCVDGHDRHTVQHDNFQIELTEPQFESNKEVTIIVEFTPIRASES